jgi:hypothetical protein
MTTLGVWQAKSFKLTPETDHFGFVAGVESLEMITLGLLGERKISI